MRPTNSDNEGLWDFIIFLLSGVHIFILCIFILRFLLRNFGFVRTSHSNLELTPWQTFLAESDIRMRRVPEVPPPPFQEALKCPLPRPHSNASSITGEEPPPAYDVAWSKEATSSVVPACHQSHQDGPATISPDLKEIVIRI